MIQSAGVSRSTLWAIVLAGGEGRRLRPLIEAWLGEPRPKQYCTFVGSRSMLRHTLDRARRLVPERRLVTVIGRGHRAYLERRRSPGTFLEQPRDAGTAAGLLLALAWIVERDPGATVLVLPADHFVHPEERFLDHLDSAREQSHRFPEHLVVLGAEADAPESDYGWLLPVRRGLDRLLRLERFREKPEPQEAEGLFHHGALWNTLVLLAPARTLWALGERLLPRMLAHFEEVRELLRSAPDGRLDATKSWRLEALYATLPFADLSRDLLQRAEERVLVHPLHGVKWSDWGRSSRIVASLLSLGKRPHFIRSAQRRPSDRATRPRRGRRRALDSGAFSSDYFLG